MDKEEFVLSLNLPFDYDIMGNDIVITVPTSDDFSLLYDTISNNRDLTLDNTSVTTTNNALFIFFSDDYELKLTANFDKDIYKLTVSDR